ncbi:MAG: hypothetical protein ACM3OB_01320 [Acidobacteriota bacterium]
MKDRHQDLEEWLAAEAAEPGSDNPAAEEALGVLLRRRLPDLQPRRGFAARVLRRAGLRQRDPFAWPAVRVAIAASLALAGCAWLLMPPVVWQLASRVGLAEVLGAVTRLLAAGGETVARAGVLWRPMTDLAAALVKILGQPAVALAVVVASTLAALALRALHGLISLERRVSYVRFH